MGLLGKRAWDLDVQLGLGMLGALLGAVAGPYYLRGRGKAWLKWHVWGTGAVLGMLWWHESWSRAYVVEAGVVWAWGVWERWGKGVVKGL